MMGLFYGAGDAVFCPKLRSRSVDVVMNVPAAVAANLA
jgi:hypothetical protein